MSGPTLLRAELEERGLKPLDLARILGVRCRIVRDVLRGHQDVRLRDVALVAQALGFSAGLLLEESPTSNKLPRETKRPRRSQVKWG